MNKTQQLLKDFLKKLFPSTYKKISSRKVWYKPESSETISNIQTK